MGWYIARDLDNIAEIKIYLFNVWQYFDEKRFF